VQLSDERRITLAELLEAWRAHVERIHDEQDFERDAGWTAHDLVAALLLRDKIKNTLEGQPPGIRSEADELLASADGVFMAMTIDDVGARVRKFADNVNSSGWWWFRLPRRGPIRADLDDGQQVS
jgi:hypothetical protein